MPSSRARAKALDTAVDAAFETCRAELERVYGDHTKEAAAWVTLVDRMIALRRDAGHEAPTLLLAEIIVLEGWGKLAPVFERLGELEPPPTPADGKRWSANIQEAIARHSQSKPKPKRR